MEKGATAASTGFSILDKNKSSATSDVVRLMELHRQEKNLDRPVDAGGGGGGGGVGPTGINSGGANDVVVGHIYRDDNVGGENFARSSTTNSQPFDIFAASYSTAPFKSPGGEMATNVAFPFTCAQWKELERQAMIYKYMISSVPVPPHLLFPLSRNFPTGATDSSVSSLYNAGYSRNGDPEPGRCKRTDGKKWRCSREVAPHQKYCERHLHRGRPRSRKPVEVKNDNGENSNKKTRLEQSRLPSSTTASQQLTAANDQPLLLFNAKPDLSISTTPSYKRTNRDLGLMMENEMVAMNGADRQWQHLVDANMGFPNEGSSIYASTAALFHQDYNVEQLQLNELPYSTGFIDAWSADNLNSNNNGGVEYPLSTNNHESLSPSLNLSIAMAAGNFLDADMGNVQIGDCAKCCDDDEQSARDSRWLSPVSWEPFARGGPLAEALHPASPRDSVGTAATTVSSPSGVLHRTVFSHSDSSVCNSPTFAGPTSEVAFQQRLN